VKEKTRPTDVVARHGATSTSFVGRIGEGGLKLWRAIEAGLTTVAFPSSTFLSPLHTNDQLVAARPTPVDPLPQSCCCARPFLR